jgi:hypothetical protein
MDLRIWIKPGRHIVVGGGYRLDADFAVHRLGDSTVLIGDIAAIRERSPESRFGDSVTRSTLEETRYRRLVVLREGAAAWFYPFGIPQRGERGVVFEITMFVGSPYDLATAAPKLPFGHPNDFILTGRNYGIEVAPRLHRARVRLEVGTAAAGWRKLFEGDAFSRMPIRAPTGMQGARGQDVLFELEAPEWGLPMDQQDIVCWHWSWADHLPPGGGSCAAAHGGRSVQRLFGSTAGHLRVTILSTE